MAPANLKPLMNQMRLMRLGMEERRNTCTPATPRRPIVVIAQRNPGEPGLQDGGSGMTNQAVDNYFAKLRPGTAQEAGGSGEECGRHHRQDAQAVRELYLKKSGRCGWLGQFARAAK